MDKSKIINITKKVCTRRNAGCVGLLALVVMINDCRHLFNKKGPIQKTLSGYTLICERYEDTFTIRDAAKLIVDEYGYVTVLDIKRLVGIEKFTNGDDLIGWDSMSFLNVKVFRSTYMGKTKYQVTFPKPKKVR